MSSCPEGYLGWNHLLTNFIKTRGDHFQKGVLTTFWPIIISPILTKLGQIVYLEKPKLCKVVAT